MMMKLGVLALALALFPLSAEAQITVPPIVPIPRPAPVPGITVTGTAQQRIGVRQVRFVAYARGASDERGVLEAMRNAGVTDPSVGSPPGTFVRDNVAIVRGTILQVSAEKLDALAAAAAAYVRAHPGSSIDNVQFYAPLAGCATLEAPVRLEALAEARRRAEAIAAATRVTLGEATALAEGGGCPGGGDAVSGPPVDTSTLTTTLSVTETVTYAIAPVSGARRRPL